MSKAINWPAQFINEVINADTKDIKIAVRLGSIYYDHCYYVPDEIVDIRVNHKITRQGKIVGDMKLCKICELTPDDFSKLKTGLKDIDSLVKYLSQNYDQEVTPEAIVTVIYYRNADKEKAYAQVDDPHM
ncbi:MAG: hypothetical protein AB1782_04795 [Cyanobacteriota bacterium]